MDLHLVNDDATEKLSYYSKGSGKIIGEHYSLLGFKDNLAVLTPHFDATKVKGQIRIIRKLPPSLNLSKLQVDESGDKFINLNGQKLKVVPQGQIPEEVRKRTMILKHQMVNTSGALKSPLQVRVISNATQVNTADKFQLVKPQSADCFITSHTDKPINIQGMKKIKLITTKLPKHTFSNQVIHTETSALSTSSVNPTITPLQLLNQGNRCSDYFETGVDKLLVVNRQHKLLNQHNLKILNQVKMQALNLSKKKIENYSPEIEKKIVLVEIGVQTDDCENKIFIDQMVQTDSKPNCQSSFDLMDFIDFDNIMDVGCAPGGSPVLSDVNFGTGPSIGKIKKTESSDFCSQMGEGEHSSSMGYKVGGKKLPDDTMKKQLLFFSDLRQCLIYNTSGNLPIHEGVLKNEVGLVKRNCTALKARKAGVNLENHNGCTPLQLAIINDTHVDIVQSLLDAGADLSETDGEGNNILHLAAKFGRQKIVEVILSHKSFSACFDCINNFNFEGLTPLMICCIADWTDGATLFIDKGANVNLKDQTSGRTALFHAAEAQSVEIVRILLDHRADPKIKNFFGTSPHDAMYELEDMADAIRNLIFGKSKKRTFEAEMNPVRTAKAAKNLRTFSRLQKIEHKDGVPIGVHPLKYKMQRRIK